MKTQKHLHYLLLGIAFLLIPMIDSCKSETELTAQEQVTAQLIAGGDSWGMESVTIDDVDESGSFSDLSIKFGATSFTTTNGGLVWPSTGTWAFTTAEATSFTRDDGVEVLIESIVADELAISLEWDKTTLDTEGGRVLSRKGKHKFRFRRIR
ncbi:MAG TPA: hypothetical protein PK185_00715 [Cyclobacteriaceae bacterium]|nr:hypothetical protein [Cyclobacteriaceae bacterium]